MSNCNHMNVFTTLPIHHKVREIPKQNTPGAIGSSHVRNYATNPWISQNKLKYVSDVCKELRPQTLLLHFIPCHNRPQFLLSRWINTEAFHFASSSFSRRRRTSCQSERVISPASTAAQRRSISAAQASSASGSISRSRLCSKRMASSARWFSGSESTSSRIRSVVSDMRRLYHEKNMRDSTQDRLTANPMRHRIAARERFLLNVKGRIRAARGALGVRQ